MSPAPALILGTQSEDHSPAVWQPDTTPHLLIASGRQGRDSVAIEEATSALCCDAYAADWDVSFLSPHVTRLAGNDPQLAHHNGRDREGPATPHALVETLGHEVRHRYQTMESDGARTSDFAPHILVVSDISGSVDILNAPTPGQDGVATDLLWMLLRCGRSVRVHVVFSGRADHFLPKWIPAEARDNVRGRWLFGETEKPHVQTVFARQDLVTHQDATSVADLGDGPRGITTPPPVQFSAQYWQRIYADALAANPHLDFRSRNNYEEAIWRAQFRADHGTEPDRPFQPRFTEPT